MKKVFGLIFVLVFFLGLVFTFSASAQPAPGGAFKSVLRLQNMSSTDVASLTVQFYNSNGDLKHTTPSLTIDPGDVITIILDESVASGEYSAVVSSDQPLASISTFSDNDSSAGYTGFNDAQSSTNWFIPGLYDDYYKYFSNIYIQNVSETAVNATLEIFSPGSSTPVYSDTIENIPAKATRKWDQAGLAELSTNVFYSGKITATGNVVAIANVYGSGSVQPQLLSYNGYSIGATKWYLPVVLNNYYGWNASLIIQNVSDTTANVSVDYSTGYSKSYTIQPFSVRSIYIPQEPLPGGKSGLFGAVINSDANVVVMVNQGNDTNNSAATYNGFSGGSQKVFAPGVMKRNSLFSTSVTCQNIGDNPTQMKLEYSSSTLSRTSPYIGVGETYLWYQPNETLPNGYNGSAVITSLNGENIACIVNQNTEDEPYFSQNWDMFSSANGINE
jgi:hypothetical protein